ncbi:pentatricopeptide repeat-containing protein [Prunus yedoensis var. nudiflora]|uniref:Pentatricopeptide repeat-containing protein n=1 Tax=Prunus yedoensis var. nudiflora TaxID=2094558 RepID=A0A314Y962_PRUYE|nr:pentatricopeptide repeat-containing protein [Prunus yedoensis var. nudiflora]
MPPQSPPPKPQNFTFFHGHHKPSQNRPTVRGGLFSNRVSLPNRKYPTATPNLSPSNSPNGIHISPNPRRPLHHPTLPTRHSSPFSLLKN